MLTGRLLFLSCFAVLVSLAIPIATAVSAQDGTDFLPEPEDIRAAYLAASADWPEVPRIAVLTFVAAQNKRFFDEPLHQSPILLQVIRRAYGRRGGRLGEYAMARVAAEALTHDEALLWYAHEIFLGQNCFGISDAAGAYFHMSAADIGLAEAAYLGGIARAPSAFHPVRGRERALSRWNTILSEMSDAGFASVAEIDAARAAGLVFRMPLGEC